MRKLLPLIAAGLLTACASTDVPGPPAPPDGPVADAPAWMARVTPEDYDRLERLGDAWTQALRQARREHAGEVEAHGALLAPGAALREVGFPNGEFRCRTIKLGSPGGGGLDYVAYGWFRCRVETRPDGGTFVKLTGSQRQVGTLYPDERGRMVFLGGLELGDLPASAPYGSHDNAVAAVLEQHAPGRWRLVIPWPRYESVLDVIELAPAG